VGQELVAQVALVLHPNLLEDADRRGVSRVAGGVQAVEAELVEAETKKQPCDFGRQSLTPPVAAKDVADLGAVMADTLDVDLCAADDLAASEQDDGERVLGSRRPVGLDARQRRFGRKLGRTADEVPTDLGIIGVGARRAVILGRPLTKGDAFAGEADGVECWCVPIEIWPRGPSLSGDRRLASVY
jgi:hypothetical protein